MLDALKSMPRAPLVIGVLGLTPFLASAYIFHVQSQGAGVIATTAANIALLSLVVYGAVILSFLGGTRWGLEIAAKPHKPSLLTLVFSVLPSIIGWVAAVIALPPLASPALGMGMIMGAFGTVLAWDLAGVRSGAWPAWYAPLRWVLTIGAILALGIGWQRWMSLISAAA